MTAEPENRLRTRLLRSAGDEEGAVSTDFVVVTAVVVGIGIAAVALLGAQVVDTSAEVRDGFVARIAAYLSGGEDAGQAAE
jgi:hypothetical protein